MYPVFRNGSLLYNYQMIRHIIFDLDCTLYPASYGLEENVARRIIEYVSAYLGKSEEEAAAEREESKTQYGTTLEWLIAEKGFTAVDDFLARVHPENEGDSLSADPELRSFLESLPCPCSVLTNSPAFHAHRFIRILGLEGIFRRVFAIEDDGFKGKPHASAFNRVLDVFGVKPDETLFIDDTPRYVAGFIALGGRGILIDEGGIHNNYPYERIRTLKELTRFL